MARLVSSAGLASNGYAIALAFLLILAARVPAAAQEAVPAPAAAQENGVLRAVKFVGGGALGLAAHESGHLLFNAVFDAGVGVRKVDFHGIPFFAVTHRSGLPPRQEFIISSAGFWMQHAGNEWLLSRRPSFRQDRAPVAKGVFAFNVLASVAYAGAAFARTGPAERDTRGMAESLGVDERWIGAMVLAPAALDAWRYFHPDAKWAAWASRGVKVGMVLLAARADR